MTIGNRTTGSGAGTDMRALRLLGWDSAPELVSVPVPDAGPGQAVVRIGGAGVCHRDLHLGPGRRSGNHAWRLPFTLGHENAGWVHALGHGATGFGIGEPVAVLGRWGCGRCARCRAGIDPCCEDLAAPGSGGGLGLDGGMAEFMLVPDVRHLVALPEGLDPVLAAPLTALTPYHAVRRSLPKLFPGGTAVVVGIGGMGHLALQVLTATTAARVIAVDVRERARQLAKDCGADLTLSTGPDAVAEIRRETAGHGADVVLDFVGSDTTLALGAATVRTLGDLTVVGSAGGSPAVALRSLPREVSVQSVRGGSRPELTEVLDLAARGLVRPVTTTYPLADAALAYRDVAAGRLAGRAVVVPGSTPGDHR